MEEGDRSRVWPRHATMDGTEQPSVYISAAALEKSYFLVVRTDRPTKDLELGIRKAIASVDPNQPVFLSTSMRTLIADSLADQRFIMTLLGITACMALAKIGIRMALGASRGSVELLIFRQGFFTTAVGLMIGLCVTFVLMRVLRGILVGLQSGRVDEILIAAGLVSLASAIACWLPARRAAQIDPMAALRHD